MDYYKTKGGENNSMGHFSSYFESHLQSVKLLRQYREVMKTIMESRGSEADNNRRTLEQAWQTIANEFYEPQDNFKSSSWAQALVTAAESLQVHRGIFDFDCRSPTM